MALEAERRSVAEQAMQHHAGHSLFDHGRTVGIYAGLMLAQTTIEKLHEDEQERLERM